MTNYEKIKSMSVDEMADVIYRMLIEHLNVFLTKLRLKKVSFDDEQKSKVIAEWKNWLESESEK